METNEVSGEESVHEIIPEPSEANVERVSANSTTLETPSAGDYDRTPLWLAIVAVMIYSVVVFSLYNQLQHLPGPIYGGDLYSHHGFAFNYISNGFWTDPYFPDNYAFYPWVGNYLFIALSFVFGITLMTAEMYIGIVTVLLSALAYYLLGKQLFKKHVWAFATMLVSLMLRGIPDGAPNLVPWMITIPFWFAFWLKAEETHSLKDKLLAGVFMGLTALSHVAYFLAAMSLFVVTILFETWRTVNIGRKYVTKKEVNSSRKETAVIKQVLLLAVKTYVPMLAVGFIVSLLFYGPILYVYHAQTKNLLFQYNGPVIQELGFSWALNVVYANVVDKTSWLTLILSFVAIIGIVVALLNMKKKEARYPLIWFFAGALTPLHHYITRPLLDRWVLPSHLFGLFVPIVLFTVLGIKFVFSHATKQSAKVSASKATSVIILILLLLFAGLTYQRVQEWHANPWVQYGQQLTPHTQAWLELGDWLQKNSDVNDVVLTNDEVCFAVNAVSGRKCVLVRRTHANYFVDVEQRYADGVVMLYGTNAETTKELLKDYKVQYVLTDNSYSQPILVEARFADYLQKNNVSFTKVTARKDPATPNAAVFQMLAVGNGEISKTLQDKIDPVRQAGGFLGLYAVKK